MLLNSQNDTYYRNLVQQISCKKALKQVQQMVDYRISEENSMENYQFLKALIEGINWKSFFDKKTQKEGGDISKMSFLTKKIKALCSNDSFVDYFPEVFINNCNSTILTQNLKKFLLQFKFSPNFELVITTTLAYQNGNLQLKQKVVSLIKDQLKEQCEGGKVLELSFGFSLFLVKFFKENQREFAEDKENLKTLFEGLYQQYKDPKMRTLFALGENSVVLQETQIDPHSADYIKYLHRPIPLHKLLEDMGPMTTLTKQQLTPVLKKQQLMPEKEIFKSILMMLKQNYNLTQKGVKHEKDFSVAQATFEFLNYEDFNIDNILLQQDKSVQKQEWDIQCFIKTLNELYGKQIKWADIFRCFMTTRSHIFEGVEEPLFFQRFFLFLRFMQEQVKQGLTHEILNGKWINQESQSVFFYFLFLHHEEVTPLGYYKMMDKKSIPQNIPNNFQMKYKDLPLLWQNGDLVRNLIELSNESEVYKIRTRKMVEQLIVQNFDQVFYLLISLDVAMGNDLLTTLLTNMLDQYFKSNSTQADIIEAFYQINKDFLVYLLVQVCKEGNFIYLSKILDFSQQIKDFFIPLTHTEYHYFSISLSLLAVKREFLRLENWIEGRLLNGSLNWIENLMVYFHKNLLIPFESYGESSQIVKEEIMERSQLTKNTIAVIFENFLLNERFMNHVESIVKEKIRIIYQSILYHIPELSQICTNDTEKKANRILEDLYFLNTSIDDFIKEVMNLKNSKSNADQEILSCIIINIIDEFRFYHQFPEKELLITSDIFGQFIDKKVIDGKVLIVFLKALSDSLEKDEKMFQFALKAIKHFVCNLTLDIHEDFYKQLFANPKLRSENYLMLYKLYNILVKQKKHLNVIPKNFVEEVSQRKKQEDKMKLEAQKAQNNLRGNLEKISLKKKLNMKSNKFQEKTLMEYLKNKFRTYEKQIILEKIHQEKIVFYLNAVEDKRLDVTDFQNLLDSPKKIKWFTVYLVYERIPHEYTNQNIYQKLIIKSDYKDLYYEIYQKSMQMINQLINYLIAKDQVSTPEYTTSRNCGKWVSLITLYSNRPILLKDFDIKAKIYRAIDEHKLGHIIPAICTILLLIEKSSFFKINVPYISSLLDVLREILYIPYIPNQTRAYIDVLFNQLKIKPQKLYPFNYLQNRQKKSSQPEKEKNIFIMKSLPDMVKIETSGILPLEVSSHDLKQLVAIAIDQSIKDIIQPVLERSVTNTLETTRELVVKDFLGEADENKLICGSEAMITNLTWNLALVTCREPLKIQIQQNLFNQLQIQLNGGIDEKVKKQLSEELSTANLKIACNIVKKIVIENALREIKKDPVLLQEISLRKGFADKQNYQNEKFDWLKNELPQDLDPKRSNENLGLIEIYSRVDEQKTPSEEGHMNLMWSLPSSTSQKKIFEKEKITELIRQLDQEIKNVNEKEKIIRLNQIYFKLNKILQQFKNVDSQIMGLAEDVLRQLFLQPMNSISIEKLKCYSDILIIYSNINSQLPQLITNWLFQIQANLFKHQLISVFLRRNLLHLKDFDQFYAGVLTQENPQALVCIIQVMKSIVIEDKIFSIHSFPEVLKKLLQIGKSNGLQSFSQEVQIFLKNLVDFIENNNKINSLMFKMTNIEPEYKKLFQDVQEYFKEVSPTLLQQAQSQLKQMLDFSKEEDFLPFVASLNELNSKNNEKDVLILFCYFIEMAVNYGTRFQKEKQVQKIYVIDFKAVDAFSKFAIQLMKNSQHSVFFFEKILTSLIITLTKKHFSDNEQGFNQKLLFRLFSNLVEGLKKGEKVFQENQQKYSLVLVQTLHILQPIKYPGFSFAWLQLVSSQYLISNLLRDNNMDVYSNYTILLIDLMSYYRDIFNIAHLQMEEVRMFYLGTLRLLLVLIHDFPDFLSEQSFLILEEIPSHFKQFRNIILSAYPKNLKVQNPFIQQDKELQEEFQKLPVLCQKIEARINSHNLHSVLINYIKKADPSQPDNENLAIIMERFYISGYQNQVKINVPLLESFIVYVPYFLYSNIYPNSTPPSFKQYLQKSYSLIMNLLLTKDYKLRNNIIQAIMNNLRYPNHITFYFIDLIVLMFDTMNKNNIFEQIFQNLLSRLIIEKPHPWGILSLLFQILTNSGIQNKKFFKENQILVDKLVQISFVYAKINTP